MENNQVVKQKIPWGMGVILLITGFGAFSAIVNAFRAPVYQLGPVLATGTLATIVQLIIGGLLALIFYGIIKRFRWARKLAICWEALLMILPLINIISFFGNQSMYDSYYQKILPPEAYSLMTHSAISGMLLFSLVPAWIFGIIIIVYLARKKDFFTK